MATDVVGLLSTLNEVQKIRLESLQKEFKNGLTNKEKPFGLSIEVKKSNFLIYEPKDSMTKK